MRKVSICKDDSAIRFNQHGARRNPLIRVQEFESLFNVVGNREFGDALGQRFRDAALWPCVPNGSMKKSVGESATILRISGSFASNSPCRFRTMPALTNSSVAACSRLNTAGSFSQLMHFSMLRREA